MAALVTLAGFLGGNTKRERYFLPDGVGVSSMNQKPPVSGALRPWRLPLTVSGPVIPAGRQTIYRMGRDSLTPSSYWLSWTTVVQAIRGFDATDPTERTYFTGAAGGPQWTDNIQALASTPYPTAARLLAVPRPTVAPTVALNTDGATGDARSLYYVFTWVNDIGWESAPSPPTLGPAAKPGAILDLSVTETVPSGAYGVNRVRWYRMETFAALNSTSAEFFFLREYATGASGMQDDARALGAKLETEEWIRLDTSASWLTYCWNQFAAAIVDKQVCFCVPDVIYAWPTVQRYTVNDTPLALASFAQRLVAFTSGGIEVFTGADPAGMDQKPLATSTIVSLRSLVVGESFCIWAAKDGLWYYGLDGYRNLVGDCIKPEEWTALVPTTIAGYLIDLGDAASPHPVYIGFYNDGTLKGFVVDPANPSGIFMLDKGYTSAYWDKYLRKLYVLDGSTLKEWDSGATFMTTTAKGKVNRQAEHAEGEWVEITADGAAQVKVWADGRLLMDRSLTSGEWRLPDGSGGREWQAEVATQGAVHALLVS